MTMVVQRACVDALAHSRAIQLLLVRYGIKGGGRGESLARRHTNMINVPNPHHTTRCGEGRIPLWGKGVLSPSRLKVLARSPGLWAR